MADIGLGTIIVLAPLAAGSWKLQVLPVLMALGLVSWAAVCLGATAGRRTVHLGVLPVVLVALALFTLLQAIPLPGGVLQVLSPRVEALRAFAAGTPTSGPISYEPGATWREVGKLVLYALVFQVAQERSRARGPSGRVALPLVVAGLLAAGVALLHRVLGIDRLFGLIDTLTSPRRMFSTFVNPNHTAGFMVLVAAAAVGLAVDARGPGRRAVFVVAAAVAAVVCVSTGSKGGIGALVVAFILFTAMLLWRRRVEPSRGLVRPAALAIVCLAAVAALVLHLQGVAILLEPVSSVSKLGLTEKAAALQDAFPMIEDHLLAGVGRGAYVSIYTFYKTSPLQLTFAFPENIAVQLLSEWGVVVGGLALLGLWIAVLGRLCWAQRAVTIAMTSGVAAVLVQNIVDFSWELPGVAIPVAAILGATSPHWLRTLRVPRTGTRFWLVAVSGPALGALALGLAFVSGDLPRDMEIIQARIRAALEKEPVSTAPPTELVVERHPASAMVAAQAAYLMEVMEPPDLPRAMALANRTLYLAPTYAGGHLVAGRLLFRAGFRGQGLGELRRAWALSGGDTLPSYMEYVVELARGPEEIAEAIPRRDDSLDTISERELARVVHVLLARGKQPWARALLSEYIDVQAVPRNDLRAVAIAADSAGHDGLAVELARRLMSLDGDDPDTHLFAARILFRHGERGEARRLLQGMSEDAPRQEALLDLRLRLEVEDRDFEAAQVTLEALRARARPSATREVELALIEADLHRRAGHLDHALRVLDEALARRASDIELRVARAALLSEFGRKDAARSDLEHVLKRRPEHQRARQLLEQIGGESE
ncbi:MAG: O-antigen ligase family protein [Deltaproteobacteria bacterium]|nr:O-antigen ligase family protein [Deltaproteobacteria bacterium]